MISISSIHGSGVQAGAYYCSQACQSMVKAHSCLPSWHPAQKGHGDMVGSKFAARCL